MKIQSFIGASSAILLVWLGATYLHKVPAERYHQQGRVSTAITGKAVDIEPEIVAGIEPWSR